MVQRRFTEKFQDEVINARSALNALQGLLSEIEIRRGQPIQDDVTEEEILERIKFAVNNIQGDLGGLQSRLTRIEKLSK